jgi:pimeloyl-ACP methyl ester carboxylesterase
MSWEGVVRAGRTPLQVRRDGEGPPLLLVNGIGAALEMWRPLASHLAGRELIAFDLPGSGRSEPRPALMRMPGFADLITELLDALGLDDAVDVLGYSLGGIVAQELAHRHSDRVQRLVLCATSPGLPSIPPNPLAACLMLTPARYHDARLARAILPVIAGGRTARDPVMLEAQLRDRLRHAPSTWGYAVQLAAVTGWSSHAWLARLRQPTLVVHGGEDPLVPVLNARYLARRIPGAALEVVARAGHLMLYDEPERVAPRIAAFLDAAA